MYLRNLVTAVVLAILFQPAAIQVASADMLVLESNVPEIRVGSRIPDGKVDLPLGGRVKVLLRSNETKVFEHPNTVSTSRSVNQPFGGTRGRRDPN